MRSNRARRGAPRATTLAYRRALRAAVEAYDTDDVRPVRWPQPARLAAFDLGAASDYLPDDDSDLLSFADNFTTTSNRVV